MKKKSFCIILCYFFLYLNLVTAQSIQINDNTQARYYPFIKTTLNHIANAKSLDAFYQKLLQLKKNGQGTISIVHIGDSHIQADYLTAVIRSDLQQFFGNAGRGLVFPYQLAQSNAPPDVASSSNTPWEFNRLAHPEIPIASGISGYCIRTKDSNASISLYLKPIDTTANESFNDLKFFLNSDTAISWIVQAKNNNTPFLIKKEKNDLPDFEEIKLEQPTDSFSITALPSNDLKEFYGVSLENSQPGIIYHTIGVNGATFDSYNSAPLFWEQLPALNADLYILSFGTNEAQKIGLSQTTFLQQVNTFIEKLKAASPNATILITTPADDFYKRRRPNALLKQIAASLASYCSHNNIPLWDLYHITGSYGSAYQWLKRGMMNNDRVHFNQEGYKVQGTLFFNAFAKGYDSYIKSH